MKKTFFFVMIAGILGGSSSGQAQENGTYRFRDFFASYCGADCPAEVDQLVFAAPDDPAMLLSMSPEDLAAFAPGGLTPVADPDRAFDGGPVTLILLPGIFGEFIPLRPFEEVLAQGGAFADRYADALKRQLTRVYVLREEAFYHKRLADVVDLASYDQDGRSLVNLVFFKPRIQHRGRSIFTLETLGKIEENATLYYERLNALMQTLEAEDRRAVYLVGYSRGANVGLELLRLVGERAPDWASSLQGLVSLAGPLWGTPAADGALPPAWLEQHLEQLAAPPPEDPSLEATEQVRRMVAACEVEPSGLPNRRLLCGLAKLSLGRSLSVEGLRELVSQVQGRSALVTAEADKYDARSAVDPEPGLQIFGFLSPLAQTLAELGEAGGEASDLYHAIRPDDSRFLWRTRLLFAKVFGGVASLTTQARRQWWDEESDQVPAGVRLYSIVGTMPGPATVGLSGEVSAVSNLYGYLGYGHDTHDFRYLLRGGYYDLLDLEPSVLINDSQVTVNSAVLNLGPEDAVLPHLAARETVMAVLGTHHWGLAFPTAFPDHSPNRYPRETLFLALGAFLAEAEAR